MKQWLDTLGELRQHGEPAISIVITATKGSVPREAGTRMVVTTADVFGTIGGGQLEFRTIQIARDMLATRALAQAARFPLAASLGQCCGGLVSLLLEPVAPDAEWVETMLQFKRNRITCIIVTPLCSGAAGDKLVVSRDAVSGTLGAASTDAEASLIARQRLHSLQPTARLRVAGIEYLFEIHLVADFNVVIFGAGHVGRALVKILAELPCRIGWIDSRDNEFPEENYPDVEKHVSDYPEDEVARMPAGSYFLVMTHSHALDQLICERILLRGDYAYFGLIGSILKRRQFERKLTARGVPAARVAEMVCPIGNIGIDSKEPMAIAVSVAMEIMQYQDAAQRQTLRDGEFVGVARAASR